MNTVFNDIIRVFLNKEALVLKDIDIVQSIVAQGTSSTVGEVRQHAQALSPGLFQLTSDKDNSMLLHLKPKIDICGAFLSGRCHFKDKPCDKLHICREFGHCRIPKCRFPHDFKNGRNLYIVRQVNCQNVDALLLVQLIRMHIVLAKQSNSAHSLPPTPNEYVQKKEPLRIDDINKQIDISFPSSKLARQVDMEIIELHLGTKNITINKIIDECEDDYFNRKTIQLEQIDDVEKLVNSPILSIGAVDIKFKRTKKTLDKSSFYLSVTLSPEQNRIRTEKIKLYISVLLGRSDGFIITESSPTGQTYLVTCNYDIDFTKFHQEHSLRPKLEEKDISLQHIYEIDSVQISYADKNKMMKHDDAERILLHVKQYVFSYELIDNYAVEVIFINNAGFKQWLSIAEKLQTKFQIETAPIVEPVNDENDGTETTKHEVENIPSTDGTDHVVKIVLRSQWALVASHPVFQSEYKDYIRGVLGGEIEVNNNEAIYKGSLPKLPKCPTDVAILVNKTNNFMQKFRYQTLRNLRPYHMKILRAHANIIAFSLMERNDYMVAAKPQDFLEIKNKLFVKTNPNPPTDRRDSTSSQPFNDRPSPTTFMSTGPPTPQTMKSPTTPPPPMSHKSSFALSTKEHISMLSINGFEDRLKQHLQEVYSVQPVIERTTVNEKKKGAQMSIIIHITGDKKNTESALRDLMNLFFSIRERKFDDQNDGTWTKMEEAVNVIQHHLKLNNLLCLFERISANTVHVLYFDITHPRFGVDEQDIENIIRNQFSLATIIYTRQSATSKFTKEWTNLEETIRKRDDYKKDICFQNVNNNMLLFGLTQLVKEYRQSFGQLTKKYVPQSCKINLSDKQLNFLTNVAKNDLSKLEKQCKDDGCDISLIRLKQFGDFLAPIDMHQRITDSLKALTTIEETKFEIRGAAFEILLQTQPDCLASIVKSKACYETKVRAQRIFISIPKSLAQPIAHENSQNISREATPRHSSSINIGQSVIKIVTGDLTTQVVDTIVVCSTSEYLCKAVLTQAGSQVQAEYNKSSVSGQKAITTSNGALPCKTIIFIPCQPDKSIGSSLKTSLGSFVAAAIKYSSQNKLTSIAFPSVGCGKFGFDPATVAKYMIDEVYEQITSSNLNMNISFVLLPSQQNVYDEFVKYLNTRSSTTAQQVPATPTTQTSRIPYDEKIIEITLYGANSNHLNKCKQEIQELSRSCVATKKLTDKRDMADWSQATIDKYYEYCLKQNVIPELDFNTHTINLTGPKDTVHEAERYFYELTTETFKQAHLDAVSRGVIWSVEVSPNSNKWEQYSFQLNGFIEDAHSKKLANYDFVNDKQERCRIVFNKMEEHHDTDIRRIQRKVVNSVLPDTWEASNQNCKRVTLQESLKEYNIVLEKFNATMRNQYSKIIKIERIQNERWYKQYAAHRDEYQQRDGKLDERSLFHGCLQTSANEIIEKCFNRSFAGVNGVAYGCGVYFHTNANYSHSYAKPNSSGERTMFLARVLIGKTCVGNQSMKVPPSGYDTTTDGQNIFVVYHDAAVYADHLITYK